MTDSTMDGAKLIDELPLSPKEFGVPDGHGKPCYFCQNEIDAFAGNPALWPTHLVDEGAPKPWHMGCATKYLNDLASNLRGIVDHWREFGEMMVKDQTDYGLDDRINAAAKLVGR